MKKEQGYLHNYECVKKKSRYRFYRKLIETCLKVTTVAGVSGNKTATG